MSRWLKDYSFDLPRERIAQAPAARRDRSRLLVMERGRGSFKERRFRSLPGLLAEGDLLVLNDSAVMPARLAARKKGTGGRVELLLLRSDGAAGWHCLIGGGAAAGTALTFDLPGVKAEIAAVGEHGEGTVRFDPPGGGELLMERRGQIPLPPYIKRGGGGASRDSLRDRRRYQTVFAARRGSVAAPTAGLHFTPGLLREIEAKGVETARVTLHVGPGTFRPLREEDIGLARLQSERAFVPAAAARAFARAKKRGGRVIAVGTTVTRTLESFVGAGGVMGRGWRDVDLMIRPGHRFRAVDGIVTNFHLPRSSLLLLVCAFAGREPVLRAYGHAVASGFRFYSYGDAMLLL